MTFDKPRKPISSPEPAPGPTQLDLLAGLMTAPCGPAPAPASRSRKPASEPVLLMNGTCGQTFLDSSALAAPVSSLASRLAARLGMLGSTESALIWSAKATPSKRLIFRLRPWTRRTSGKGSIGSPWPTVVANPDNKSPEAHLAMKRRMGERDGTGSNRTAITDIAVMMKASAWPTPQHRDFRIGAQDRWDNPARSRNLNDLMSASPWVTPSSRDWKDTPGMETERPDGRSRLDQLPRQMAASWATPQARDSFPPHTPNYIAEKKAQGHGMRNLNDEMAQTAAWPTPCSLSFDASHQPGNNRSINKTLELVQGTPALSGPTPNGSTAMTEKRAGAPNPYFAMWLMGFPDEFATAVLTALIRLRSKS